MKIGYRRYSGKIFLDFDEKITSKRGAWLEKRIAFLDLLKKRGHEIIFIRDEKDLEKCELVFLEFGSLNKVFYGESINFSESISGKRKTIFLLDDPDLMPQKRNFHSVWANADPRECAHHFGLSTNFEYAPFHSLQNKKEPTRSNNGRIVYYGGTSGGREKRILKYQTFIKNLDVYGQKKDYSHISPMEPPTQKDRREFYSKFLACFNITDNLHKKLKWRTGRKYHAILAGCPAFDETIFEIEKMKNLTNIQRLEIVEMQQEEVSKEKETIEKLFEKYGL